MSENKQHAENLDASVGSTALLPCPFCGCAAGIHQSFDVDCQSTTAWIECGDCDCKYGPLYPETKQDVIDWMQKWNRRLYV